MSLLIALILLFQGVVSLEPEQIHLQGGDISVFRTFPKWEMFIQVDKDFLLAYGPWADRQREMLWKFFFPPSYRPMEITPPARVGELRVAQKFVLDVKSSTAVRMDLWFTEAKKQANKFSIHGDAGSTFKLTLPWVTGVDGYTTKMALSLTQGRMVTDCLWHDLLTSSQFDLNLRVHYPCDWNSLQTWDFDIDGKDAVFCMLFTQKDYFKGECQSPDRVFVCVSCCQSASLTLRVNANFGNLKPVWCAKSVITLVFITDPHIGLRHCVLSF